MPRVKSLFHIPTTVTSRIGPKEKAENDQKSLHLVHNNWTVEVEKQRKVENHYTRVTKQYMMASRRTTSGPGT